MCINDPCTSEVQKKIIEYTTAWMVVYFHKKKPWEQECVHHIEIYANKK